MSLSGFSSQYSNSVLGNVIYIPDKEPAMQLYEYILVYNGDFDDWDIIPSKDTEHEEGCECACEKLYTIILAKDEATARIIAARSIPDEYDAEEVTIYLKRWGNV